MRAIWPTVAAESAGLGNRRCLKASAKPAKLPAISVSTVSSPVTLWGIGASGENRPVVGRTWRHVAGEHLKQEGEQEARRHGAEDRDQPHQIVDPSILVRRRDHAKGNADKKGDRDR
jgi:hypothetical protein